MTIVKNRAIVKRAKKKMKRMFHKVGTALLARQVNIHAIMLMEVLPWAFKVMMKTVNQ